jgi:HEAT repeat protein
VETLDALRAAARETTGDGNDDVVTRGAMLRAVGPLGRDDAPEDVRDEARATIRQLVVSDDLESRVAGLDAAGNAGTEALLDVVQTGFEDERPAVRASAYNALRDMPRDLIQPVITDALQHERDGSVRRALVTAAYTNANAAARPYVDPLLARAVVSTLGSTPDEGARAAAIRLAGIAAPQSAEVRAELASWLEQESDPSVIQVLGRFLSVSEARAALARARGAQAEGTH